MKVRSGFVSNSSSSSFIIRGVKLKINNVAKRLGVDPNVAELHEKIYDKFGYSHGIGKVAMESTRCYFDDDGRTYNTADVIVGVRIVDLDDGEVGVIPDPDDSKIRQKIEKKIGSIGDKKLKTYIQFVSNDNF